MSSPALPVQLVVSPSLQESCFSLAVRDDEDSEGPEDLRLQLSNLGNTDVILSPDRITITISDNDIGTCSL